MHTVLGRVRRVHPAGDAVEIEIDDGHDTHRVHYDLVVTAIGFDVLWWLPLFTDAGKRRPGPGGWIVRTSGDP